MPIWDVFASYTPVNQMAEYLPPDLTSGPTPTRYTYDTSRRMTSIIRPDGQIVTNEYDSAGRLSAIGWQNNRVELAYDSAGRVAQSRMSDGVNLDYTYDAFLPISVSWSGPVSGQVSAQYDDDFRITEMFVNGMSAATYQYDEDSLLIQAGRLSLTRDPVNGLLNASGLGGITDVRLYNGFSETTSYCAQFNGSDLFSEIMFHDALGRITNKTEIMGGATNGYAYEYDLNGRLISVASVSGVNTYAYDANGNRTNSSLKGSLQSAIFDGQDRLLFYGPAIYQYNAAGDLTNKVVNDTIATAYEYDALDRLLAVILPDGRRIEYVIDAVGRRVGRKVDGILTQGWLYADGLRPIAELDGSGNVVSMFVYGTRFNVPDYMVKNGVTYRIISDHLGSARLVANVDTGEIAQRLDYDEWGRVLSDSNSGFQPFGFAGGLYDQDIGLVRFGARDYDPEIGRWTAKDPILFAGGQGNLYLYCNDDCINLIDPFGLFRFGKRPLGRLPRWTMSPNSTLADLWNIQTVHEQGFFDDGSGENIGLDRSGTLHNEKQDNYIFEDIHYDDELMREAMENTDFGGYSLVGQRWWKFWVPSSERRYKNNCQDYADRLREEYNRLKKERGENSCK